MTRCTGDLKNVKLSFDPPLSKVFSDTQSGHFRGPFTFLFCLLHGFTSFWASFGRILFVPPQKNKNLFWGTIRTAVILAMRLLVGYYVFCSFAPIFWCIFCFVGRRQGRIHNMTAVFRSQTNLYVAVRQRYFSPLELHKMRSFGFFFFCNLDVRAGRDGG